MILKQSVGYVRVFWLKQSATHYTPLTGATPAVSLSKAGAAFAAAAGAVAEIGVGFYKITLTTVDTNTVGDLAYSITSASADPQLFVDQVKTTIFTDLSMDASGQANISTNIKQNTALNGFTFVMTDSSSHAPAAGKTVTAQRSLGGAGFSTCANAVSELSNGLYVINLAAGDLNAATVTLRFTATDCDDRVIELITQP